ncbi:DUF6907 domain-containing protein [Streptomyces caeruleatus]|uniref:Uncharacterized protein n=1 Tax=Streptomyces caeruleatus TaxID=661399 RepID=A0A117RK87_9ACTN|nr:hypothetical protein [Streptomyces caeruleatus]KUN95398.1 hypothetical protein AQJ67_36015 [Streptomyces caeruleatus]
MQDPIRSITLPTLDHGDVVLAEPSWCAGHADHRPDTARVEILHCGPDVELTFRGRTVMDASLVQSPFTTNNVPELDTPTPGISVGPIGRTLDPASVYELAAALDGYADRLRDLADQLARILAGGEQ